MLSVTACKSYDENEYRCRIVNRSRLILKKRKHPMSSGTATSTCETFAFQTSPHDSLIPSTLRVLLKREAAMVKTKKRKSNKRAAIDECLPEVVRRGHADRAVSQPVQLSSKSPNRISANKNDA
jgi:hypothetical protein